MWISGGDVHPLGFELLLSLEPSQPPSLLLSTRPPELSKLATLVAQNPSLWGGAELSRMIPDPGSFFFILNYVRMCENVCMYQWPPMLEEARSIGSLELELQQEGYSCTVPDFLRGFWDLNSGPQAGTVSTFTH